MITHMAALAGELLPAGHRLAVGAPPDVLQRLYGRLDPGGSGARPGERVVLLFPLPVRDGVRALDDVASAVRLARLVRELRPCVVHLHGYKATIVGALAAGLCARSLRCGGKPPLWVSTLHNALPARRAAILRWADHEAGRWALRRMDRVIAVSDQVARMWEPDLGEQSPERLRVIPNGLPDRWFDAAPGWAPPEAGRPWVFGCLTRLIPSKRVHVAILAAAELESSGRQARLLVGGDGPLRHELEALVRRLGAGRAVRLLGPVDDPRRFWAGVHAAVFPSAFEGFGYALLEAMASRRPVIASAGANLEPLLSAGGGLLVPGGDPVELASAMRRLMDDPARTGEMARRAREAAGRFRASAMARAILELYRAGREATGRA